jgi:hypothetical protein
MRRRFSNIEHGMTLHAYATPACRSRCAVKANCTGSIERREHEEVIKATQARRDRLPGTMRVPRRARLGHSQRRRGRSHFKTRRLENVGTEISLHILDYNSKRAIALVGVPKLLGSGLIAKTGLWQRGRRRIGRRSGICRSVLRRVASL